jgi:hypothetical protein
MATTAQVAFSVSSLNLISIAGGNGGPKGGKSSYEEEHY